MALAEENLDILFAAISVAGPKVMVDDGREERIETDTEYTGRVVDSAKLVTLLGQSGSTVMKAIDSIADSQAYPANIVEVGFEKSSQRPLVILEVKPSKYAKNGEEEIRSLRVDEPGGEELQAQLKSLVDRRVLIRKGFDKSDRSEGKGFKKIIAVEDLGEARDFD